MKMMKRYNFLYRVNAMAELERLYKFLNKEKNEKTMDTARSN